MSLLPVVLSGGSGTRLWPLSRPDLPKQFLALPGPDTMIQATLRRLECIGTRRERPLVVGNAAHRDLITGQLAEVGHEPDLIVEPTGRNTAPAVALAAHCARARGLGDTPMLVMPADHVIADAEAFGRSVDTAIPYAQDGALVTFGVVPTSPHTGYGYIRTGNPDAPAPVAEFVEKPDAERAQRYLASGDFLWNAGIFLFTANRFLEELVRYAPDIAEASAASLRGIDAGPLMMPDADKFAAVRAESIDYAVMEKTDSAIVVPLSAGWSDIGSWSSLCDAIPADADGNVFTGAVVAEDTRRTGVFGGGRTIAVAGLADAVVVDAGDCVLVTTKAAAQHVKTLVAACHERGDPVAARHARTTYSWGTVEALPLPADPPLESVTLAAGAAADFLAAAGARLIGAVGTLSVSAGATTTELGANATLTLPQAGTVRLSNAGSEPVSVITQSLAVAGEAAN